MPIAVVTRHTEFRIDVTTVLNSVLMSSGRVEDEARCCGTTVSERTRPRMSKVSLERFADEAVNYLVALGK